MTTLISCDFFSEVLGLSTSMNVILPQKLFSQPETGNSTNGKYPVLLLLHGLSDDHNAWVRRTSIERYVDNLGLAVVMPCVHRSFYNDMAHGNRYSTFISEELPFIVRSLFPLSERREDNFVAGLSMGGYGALKLALSFPDRFAAGASLSGAVDITNRRHENVFDKDEYYNIFGDFEKVPGSKCDLFHLAKELAAYRGDKPKLFQCCGTEDFLYDDNVRFRDHLRKLGLDLVYEEESGTHEWGYWDCKIRRVLEWLPLKRV